MDLEINNQLILIINTILSKELIFYPTYRT